jgi:hypothetical protein
MDEAAALNFPETPALGHVTQAAGDLMKEPSSQWVIDGQLGP